MQISYYSINSVTNKKVVLSADGYIIFVGHLWIDKISTPKYFILRDDIQQNVKIDFVYSIQLPSEPAKLKETLSFQIFNNIGELVFRDDSLPAVSGMNQIYSWDGLPSKNNVGLPISDVYCCKLLLGSHAEDQIDISLSNSIRVAIQMKARGPGTVISRQKIEY